MELSEVRSVFRHVYRNINGFSLAGLGPSGRSFRNKYPLVYGELTLRGVHQMMEMAEVTEKDSFYDLGCGVGKIVLQIAMTLPLRRAVGVEITEERHQGAISALSRMRKLQLVQADSCSFRHQNMLDANLSNATVLYFASTCFSERVVRKVIGKLQESRRTRRLVLLTDIAKKPAGVELVTVQNVQTTWHAKQKAFLFHVHPL